MVEQAEILFLSSKIPYWVIHWLPTAQIDRALRSSPDTFTWKDGAKSTYNKFWFKKYLVSRTAMKLFHFSSFCCVLLGRRKARLQRLFSHVQLRVDWYLFRVPFSLRFVVAPSPGKLRKQFEKSVLWFSSMSQRVSKLPPSFLSILKSLNRP